MHSDNTNWFMILRLAKNDLKSRYANYHLGMIWAFAMPLITILVFWFVFEAGLRNPPVDDVPYILWFAAAYIPWTFFQDTLSCGTNCLIEYSFLVKKIKFKIAWIPLIKLMSGLLVHLFFLGFLLILYACYQVPCTIYIVQMLYYTFAMAVLSLGLVYLCSAFTVFFKDTASIVNVLLQIGFWSTPILWNELMLQNPLVETILGLNPMYYIVSGFRQCLISGGWFWERGTQTLYFWGVTILLLYLGITVFNRLSPLFADEV